MDIDHDGHVDLISGSWPGELFLFRGGPDRTFAAPVKIQDRTGKYINIGGGIREGGFGGGGLLIAGDAQFEQRDGKQVVVYNGEVIDVPEDGQVGITGTASAVYASDWDGDGDHDLLVGDINGNVYLVPNEGTPRAYAFGAEQNLQAGGTPIRVAGDAGPHAADWDGDGDLDLLVGDGSGAVTLFENTGSPDAPELAEGRTLVPAGTMNYSDPPAEPTRGGRSKVCVADWNGDGRPDLLLGDFAYQKPNLPEPTAEEKARHDELRKELETVQQRYSELVNALYRPSQPSGVAGAARSALDRLLGRAAEDPPVDRKTAEEEMPKVLQRMQELREALPPEMENHGWVWLFLRQPATADGPR